MNIADIMELGAQTAIDISGQSIVFYDVDGSSRTINATVAVDTGEWVKEDERRNVQQRIRVGAINDDTDGIGAVVIGKQSVAWVPPGESVAVRYTVVGLVGQSNGHTVITCERQTVDQIRQRGRIAERMGGM